MEARAKLKYLRMAPRKVRYVADLIRGKSVGDALDILTFVPRAAAAPLSKLVHSAVANAEEKGISDVDQMTIRIIQVDEGPTIKRWLPRALGRATRIRKRTSHVKLVIEQS
ncbi:MAG: 50S ribosomal protein L22 [Deltaproteobacteria bacterium]|nr:50S ribosomal protein L22 [Deltaproteobacteria bacterium]